MWTIHADNYFKQTQSFFTICGGILQSIFVTHCTHSDQGYEAYVNINTVFSAGRGNGAWDLATVVFTKLTG